MKKIKIFLGGYINSTNAQNLNCLAITQNLDKERFEIFVMKTYFGNKECVLDDVNIFNCFRPFKMSSFLGFFWGMINCDVAYLPKKLDTPIWVLKLARILNKPIFTTIEGNVYDDSKQSLVNLFGNKEIMDKHFHYFTKTYAITQHLYKQVSYHLDIEKKPLYLGVDYSFFSNNYLKHKLNTIVFVGSLIKRKRVCQILKLAEYFKHISFIIIGDGKERLSLEKKSTKNVSFLGNLSHSEIREVFLDSDLFFLPSLSEGFPKVILEAASAGIPSIVYNNYGANEWITNNKDGFIVSDFNQVIKVVQDLLDNKIILNDISREAKNMGMFFNWNKVIVEWENRIEELVDSI